MDALRPTVAAFLPVYKEPEHNWTQQQYVLQLKVKGSL
jgi:hypothetical protein